MEPETHLVQLREKIIDQTTFSYGKLLNPLRKDFRYTLEDLLLYLEFAHTLCMELLKKFHKILKIEGIYKARYEKRTKLTAEQLKRTAQKMKILYLRLVKYQQGSEESLEQIYTEVISQFSPKNHEEQGFDGAERGKIRRFSHKILNKSRDFGLTDEDSSNNHSPIRSQSTIGNTKIVGKDTSQSSKSTLGKVNYGVSPTALATETCIIILLKMETALDNLLRSPNNHDY